MSEVMTFILSLISPSLYFDRPTNLSAWLGLVVLVLISGVVIYRWRKYHPVWNRPRIILAAMLLLLVPVSTGFIGFRLPPGPAPPFMPIEPKGPVLMVFAALPWALAAGFLGPGPAAVLGGLAGMLLGLWETHSILTPISYAILGMLLGGAAQQRYRTVFYRALRHPLLASILIALFYPLLVLISGLLQTSGTLIVRLEFSLTQIGFNSLTMAGQLLVAGIIAEVAAYGWSSAWGGAAPYEASPVETSLETRVQYIVGGLVILLVCGLMIGDWIVAGNAARQMLQQRMTDTAQIGAESIPFFLEAGQNLILQIASDPALTPTSGEDLESLLTEHIRTTPYFRQLYLLDAAGEPITGYPLQDFNSLFPTREERTGIDLARRGVAFQYYAVPPGEFESAAQISFIAAQKDAEGDIRGVLLGRTDLASNPFTQPVLNNLTGLSTIGGEGMLVDEDRKILYHPLSNLVMTLYEGQFGESPIFYDDTAPDGTRNLVLYYPVTGRAWAVVLTVSAQQSQQLALNIAAPLLGVLAFLSVVVFGLMRLGVQVVTRSLHGLATEADRIAGGDLDHPLEIQGVDEVGQLAGAFEEMRIRLKSRLDELEQLFLVTQGVAASLEVDAALRPVLESALTTGAVAAYVTLTEKALPDLEEKPESWFAAGPAAEKFHHLGAQIRSLTSQQDQIALTNPARARMLQIDPGQPVPEAVFAAALHHENIYVGCLWVAYDQPHPFSTEEKNFLSTLAFQASLGVGNARSYMDAEIGRQRLEAILHSTPDPVLVTDYKDQVYLANPAAMSLLIDAPQSIEGLPLEQVIIHQDVIAILKSEERELQTVEIELPDGRFYYATASSVRAEGKRVGRVCVLQDITRFKELDSLKSEFVNSVSHDLRSPLALMQGYATMLQMVGELNEQQTGYVRKIIQGVENMARLVTNLLDLGRIEAGVGLKLEKVPIVELVERVTGALQLQAAQKRIELGADIPAHVTPMIEADQALIDQALQNLVDNAIKYTKTGGAVRIRLFERNQRIIFEVRDNGIGIAPLDIPRLFERFYRGARREARQQRGTGLGLAIVKSIAERHNGRVWVESQLGKGSQFFLEIPISQLRPNTDKPEVNPA